jgi:hypothetical protein
MELDKVKPTPGPWEDGRGQDPLCRSGYVLHIRSGHVYMYCMYVATFF